MPGSRSLLVILSYIYIMLYKTSLSACAASPPVLHALFHFCVLHYTVYPDGRSVYVFRSALRLRNLSGGHGGVRAHHPAGAVEGPTESVVGGLHHQRNAPPALRPVVVVGKTSFSFPPSLAFLAEGMFWILKRSRITGSSFLNVLNNNSNSNNNQSNSNVKAQSE
jgi:hypothetical protein